MNYLPAIAHSFQNRKLNWTFRIAVVAFLSFLFFKKDITFSIQLGIPSVATTSAASSVGGGASKQAPQTLQADANIQPITIAELTSPAAKKEIQVIDEQQKQKHLKRFASVAQAEMKKFNVPASVLVAMSLMESGAGASDLTRRANNFFGLVCTDAWQGATYPQGGVCYRKYDNAWSSFRDFSEYLSKLPNRPSTTNHAKWIDFLRRSNYIRFDSYANNLLQTIEQEQLFRLDK
jgi:flagellum-specific peptidoglycan hydrolase FlgJ